MCAALNASITGYVPRKLFAIGLTVEQISQCSGSWHERGVDSTKNIFIRKQKISKCSMEGQEPKIMFNKSKSIRSRKLKVEQQACTTEFQAADSGHFPEIQ